MIDLSFEGHIERLLTIKSLLSKKHKVPVPLLHLILVSQKQMGQIGKFASCAAEDK